MLDIFIIFGTILALLFGLYGLSKNLGWPTVIGAILFLVIGMGIFVTGWETYLGGNVTITSDGDTDTVSYSPQVFNPVLEGNPNEQVVYSVAIFYLGLALIGVFLAIREALENRLAQKSEIN